VSGTESGDLDNLAPETDVCQAETAPDQAAIPEQMPDFIRGRIGGHVKILGFTSQQQVTHPAPNQKALEPALFEAVQHL